MNQPPRQYAVWARPNPFFPRMIVAVRDTLEQALLVSTALYAAGQAAEVLPHMEAPVAYR